MQFILKTTCNFLLKRAACTIICLKQTLKSPFAFATPYLHVDLDQTERPYPPIQYLSFDCQIRITLSQYLPTKLDHSSGQPTQVTFLTITYMSNFLQTNKFVLLLLSICRKETYALRKFKCHNYVRICIRQREFAVNRNTSWLQSC